MDMKQQWQGGLRSLNWNPCHVMASAEQNGVGGLRAMCNGRGTSHRLRKGGLDIGMENHWMY